MKNIKAKIAEYISKKFEVEAPMIESMLEYPIFILGDKNKQIRFAIGIL